MSAKLTLPGTLVMWTLAALLPASAYGVTQHFGILPGEQRTETLRYRGADSARTVRVVGDTKCFVVQITGRARGSVTVLIHAMTGCSPGLRTVFLSPRGYKFEVCVPHRGTVTRLEPADDTVNATLMGTRHVQLVQGKTVKLTLAGGSLGGWLRIAAIPYPPILFGLKRETVTVPPPHGLPVQRGEATFWARAQEGANARGTWTARVYDFKLRDIQPRFAHQNTVKFTIVASPSRPGPLDQPRLRAPRPRSVHWIQRNPGPGPTLSWKKVEGAAAYHVAWRPATTPNWIQRKVTETRHRPAPVRPGNCEWRVQAVAGSGSYTVTSQWSETRTFTVRLRR